MSPHNISYASLQRLIIGIKVGKVPLLN